MGVIASYLSRIVPLALLVGWLSVAMLVALLATIAMMAPAHASTLQAAGVIVSSDGDTSLSRTGQITSPAGRLQEVFAGDRLLTGSNGRISLRFSDGMQMNLGPASQLSIDDYLHNDQGDRGWFDLIRGSLRTVTGLIGKRSAKSFRLKTPTAVIGVRGTDFSVVQRDCHAGQCTSPTLGAMEVTVASGAIDVANGSGQVRVKAGQTARIGNLGAKPVLVRAPTMVTPKRPGRLQRKSTKTNHPPQKSSVIRRASSPGKSPGQTARTDRHKGPRLPFDAPGTDEFLAPE